MARLNKSLKLAMAQYRANFVVGSILAPLFKAEMKLHPLFDVMNKDITVEKQEAIWKHSKLGVGVAQVVKGKKKERKPDFYDTHSIFFPNVEGFSRESIQACIDYMATAEGAREFLTHQLAYRICWGLSALIDKQDKQKRKKEDMSIQLGWLYGGSIEYGAKLSRIQLLRKAECEASSKRDIENMVANEELSIYADAVNNLSGIFNGDDNTTGRNSLLSLSRCYQGRKTSVGERIDTFGFSERDCAFSDKGLFLAECIAEAAIRGINAFLERGILSRYARNNDGEIITIPVLNGEGRQVLTRKVYQAHFTSPLDLIVRRDSDNSGDVLPIYRAWCGEWSDYAFSLADVLYKQGRRAGQPLYFTPSLYVEYLITKEYRDTHFSGPNGAYSPLVSLDRALSKDNDDSFALSDVIPSNDVLSCSGMSSETETIINDTLDRAEEFIQIAYPRTKKETLEEWRTRLEKKRAKIAADMIYRNESGVLFVDVTAQGRFNRRAQVILLRVHDFDDEVISYNGHKFYAMNDAGVAWRAFLSNYFIKHGRGQGWDVEEIRKFHDDELFKASHTFMFGKDGKRLSNKEIARVIYMTLGVVKEVITSSTEDCQMAYAEAQRLILEGKKIPQKIKAKLGKVQKMNLAKLAVQGQERRREMAKERARERARLYREAKKNQEIRNN